MSLILTAVVTGSSWEAYTIALSFSSCVLQVESTPKGPTRHSSRKTLAIITIAASVIPTVFATCLYDALFNDCVTANRLVYIGTRRSTLTILCVALKGKPTLPRLTYAEQTKRFLTSFTS